MVMRRSFELIGDGVALAGRRGARETKRGDPKAAPLVDDEELSGAAAPSYLRNWLNSGCGTAMFLVVALKSGYSGSVDPFQGELPASIRFTVASQKPSNSRASPQ